MPPGSLLRGVPAAVVCGYQVQLARSQRALERLPVRRAPEGRAHHVGGRYLEVRAPAARMQAYRFWILVPVAMNHYL